MLDKTMSIVAGQSSLRDIDLLDISFTNIQSFKYTAGPLELAKFKTMPTSHWWRTERGHSVLCCTGTQAGDHVAVLYGAKNLSLIRGKDQTGGCYQLIGNCFLDRSAQDQIFLNQETTIDLI